MKDDEKLNRLVDKAKAGCGVSLWEIKSHFWKDITDLSQANASKINSQFSFEEGCYNRITAAVRRFDPKRGCFDNYVRFNLHQLLQKHILRGERVRKTLSLEQLLGDGVRRKNDDKKSNFDIKDDLTVVDADILAKEKVALLTEDDPRRMSVLVAWTNGVFNDSETASMLTHRFGGKSESHRKFISRFRTFCQTALSNAI